MAERTIRVKIEATLTMPGELVGAMNDPVAILAAWIAESLPHGTEVYIHPGARLRITRLGPIAPLTPDTPS